MRKILLISGHGAGDPGTTSNIKGIHYEEAKETIKVAQALKTAIEKYDLSADLYPVSNNAYDDCVNGTFAGLAKPYEYDFILEIHFNSCVQDLVGDGDTTGVEIYTCRNVEQWEKELPTIIVNNVANIGFTNRGVKEKSFNVIYKCQSYGVQAALLETCFLDDADDIALYNNKFNEIIANIAAAIAEYFGVGEKEIMKKQDIKVKINGKQEVVQGYFVDGVNYVPVRIFEKAGAKINWDMKEQTVIIENMK